MHDALGEEIDAATALDAKWLNDFRLQVSGGPRKPGARN